MATRKKYPTRTEKTKPFDLVERVNRIEADLTKTDYQAPAEDVQWLCRELKWATQTVHARTFSQARIKAAIEEAETQLRDALAETATAGEGRLRDADAKAIETLLNYIPKVLPNG